MGEEHCGANSGGCFKMIRDLFSRHLTTNLDLDFFREIGLDPRDRTKELGVFCHIHCLPSLTSLIQALRRVGVSPTHIFIIPKIYSAIPSTIAALQALEVQVLLGQIEFRPGLYDEAAQFMLEENVDSVARAVRRLRLRGGSSSSTMVACSLPPGGWLLRTARVRWK